MFAVVALSRIARDRLDTGPHRPCGGRISLDRVVPLTVRSVIEQKRSRPIDSSVIAEFAALAGVQATGDGVGNCHVPSQIAFLGRYSLTM